MICKYYPKIEPRGRLKRNSLLIINKESCFYLSYTINGRFLHLVYFIIALVYIKKFSLGSLGKYIAFS